MKNVLAVTAICIVLLVFMLLSTIGYVVSSLNSEARIINDIVAQEEVNKVAFDKMWKIIAQSTQITQATFEFKSKAIEALVNGRTGGLVKLIHEQNPESAFTTEQANTLQNMVTTERDAFFREQKLLISKIQEQHNMLDTQPRGMILSFFGRTRYPEPKLITSAQTEEAVESGQENDVELGL